VRRTALLSLLCVLSGCAAAVARDPTPSPGAAVARVAAAPNYAAELAHQLPPGADRCAIARPVRLSLAQRPLLARISQAEPLAWTAQLQVVAYVSAERSARDAPLSRVSLLWLSDEPERVRAVLDAHDGLDLDWGEAGRSTCEHGCAARARFVAPHVLRIERGQFPQGSSEGAERHCQRMAEGHPDALELAFKRARGAGSLALDGRPLTTSFELRDGREGVHVERSDLMPSMAEAAGILGDPLAAELLLAPLSLVSNLRREQADAMLRTDYDVLWEDLELARDDEARMRELEQQAGGPELPMPDTLPDPGRREDLLAQLGYRLEQVRRASGEQRRAQAEGVRGLLERAVARSPDDEGLALLLAELLLTELRDGGPVSDLARRFAPLGSASRARWGLLRRHAAALAGVDALTDALLRDHAAERRKARAFAQAILAQWAEGAPYEQAERAVLGAAKTP
jgi:hypothetical protein